MIGPTYSQVTLAVLPILNEAKIASVNVSGSERLTPEVGPYAFSMLANAEAQSKLMVDHAVRALEDAVGGDPHGHRCPGEDRGRGDEGRAGRAQLKLAGVQEYQYRQTDMTPQLLTLRRGNAGRDPAVHQQRRGHRQHGEERRTSSAGASRSSGASARRSPARRSRSPGKDAYKNLVAVNYKGFRYCPKEPADEEFQEFVGQVKAFKPEAFDRQPLSLSLALVRRGLRAEGSGRRHRRQDRRAQHRGVARDATRGSFRGINSGLTASKTTHFLVGPEALTVVYPGPPARGRPARTRAGAEAGAIAPAPPRASTRDRWTSSSSSSCAGIGLGAVYSLVAISFNVVHNSSGILNFAQGNMLVLGGLFGFFTLTQEPDVTHWLLLLPAAALLYAAVLAAAGLRHAAAAALVGRAAFVADHDARRVGDHRCGDPDRAGAARAQREVAVPELRAARHADADALCARGRCWRSPGAPACTGSTRAPTTGLAMSAIAQDLEAARAVGIRVRRLQVYAFAISGAIVGSAGFVAAPVMSISADSGNHLRGERVHRRGHRRARQQRRRADRRAAGRRRVDVGGVPVRRPVPERRVAGAPDRGADAAPAGPVRPDRGAARVETSRS